MSSADEIVDINELKAARKENATDDVKERVTEAQKRYQVAREIENHQVFMSLKSATKNANIGLMLDAIVDRYFDFVSGNNMTPVYKVDSGLVQMALIQTIYLIKVEENGIVLNEDGTINEEESLKQQANMERMSFSSANLTDEQKKAYYMSALEKGIEDKEISENLNADFLLESLKHYDSTEMYKYLNTDEGRDYMSKALNNKTTKTKIKDNRIKANLEDEEDVRINELQGRMYELSTQKPLQRKDYQQLSDCIKELQELAETGDYAKKFLNENGQIDATKVLTDYVEYIGAYSNKENEKILQHYGGKKLQKLYTFDKLPPDDKRKVMEAALSLYMQPGGNDKKEATLVLSAMNLLTEDPINGEKVIDKDAFRYVYNGTSKMSNLTFDEIVKQVYANDVRATREHTKMLYQQVLDGTFTERSDEELSKEEILEQIDEKEDFELKENEPDAPKEKFWDKVGRRLRENYRKSLELEAIEKFKDATLDLTDEERVDCMIRAYVGIRTKRKGAETRLKKMRAKEGTEENRITRMEMQAARCEEAEDILLGYMLSHQEEGFGNVIDQDIIKENKEISYNVINWSSKDPADREKINELNNRGITPNRLAKLFEEVADYPMTPARIAKGAVESAKDLSGVIKRRIQFSRLGKLFGDRMLAISDRSRSTADEIEAFREAQYDKEAIKEAVEAFNKGETVRDFSKRKEQERKAEENRLREEKEAQDKKLQAQRVKEQEAKEKEEAKRRERLMKAQEAKEREQAKQERVQARKANKPTNNKEEKPKIPFFNKNKKVETNSNEVETNRNDIINYPQNTFDATYKVDTNQVNTDFISANNEEVMRKVEHDRLLKKMVEKGEFNGLTAMQQAKKMQEFEENFEKYLSGRKEAGMLESVPENDTQELGDDDGFTI